MFDDPRINDFLSQYDEKLTCRVQLLRQLLFDVLSAVTEQPDLPARMIAYTYGQRYTDMICTIIPSRKGLKLGFYKGTELPDPECLLEGSGKISRYVVLKTDEQLAAIALKNLLHAALEAYRVRTGQ